MLAIDSKKIETKRKENLNFRLKFQYNQLYNNLFQSNLYFNQCTPIKVSNIVFL